MLFTLDDESYSGLLFAQLHLLLMEPSVLISPQEEARGTEGGSGEYGVKLASRPTGIVTVEVMIDQGGGEIGNLKLNGMAQPPPLLLA